MSIGKKISELRSKAQWSQQHLANELSVSRSAVAKWESDHGVPDIENLKALSKVFEVSLDVLLENNTIKKDVNLARKEILVKKEELIAGFINQRCDIDLSGWNDGVFGGYITNYDSLFVYYTYLEKEGQVYGAISRAFITSIEETKGRERFMLNVDELKTHKIEDFYMKETNLELNDKNFWSGFIGEATVYEYVYISSLETDHLVIDSHNMYETIKVPLSKVVKFEVKI